MTAAVNSVKRARKQVRMEQLRFATFYIASAHFLATRHISMEISRKMLLVKALRFQKNF